MNIDDTVAPSGNINYVPSKYLCLDQIIHVYEVNQFILVIVALSSIFRRC